MIDWLIALWLFLVGAIFGSYAVATVWRLRAKELSELELVDLSSSDKKEYNLLIKKVKLDKISTVSDYSRCLNCQHRLMWYDLIPVFSWLSLRGKCRYCGAPIGWTEFLAEVALGGLFALSYLLNSQKIILLALWLVLLIILTILFVYDAKWQLLPTRLLWLAIAISSVIAIVRALDRVNAGEPINLILTHFAGSLAMLSGLYWLLAALSKQAWVGSGDAYVGAVVALVLGNFWLSSIALFLANLIGCLVVFAIAILKKKSVRRMRVAFGPMLIMALLIVYFLEALILQKIGWFVFDI